MWFILTTMNINIMTASHHYRPCHFLFVFILTLSHSYTHNFCMRVSRAERTAWISDPEQVHTTGSFWACSSSATYCRHTESYFSYLKLNYCKYVLSEYLSIEVNGYVLYRVVRQAHRKWSRLVFTCPCQSLPFTKIRLSGRVLSDSRIWLSWSYTIFLGICKEECDWKHLLRLAF